MDKSNEIPKITVIPAKAELSLCNVFAIPTLDTYPVGDDKIYRT